LHFWVQVKAGKQVKVGDGKAKCIFQVDRIKYWSRQPVPVYAFLIPEDQLRDLEKKFVISFTRKLFNREIPVKGQESRTLESDLIYYTHERLYNLRTFVDNSVRIDHVVLMYMLHGLSVPMPEVEKEYVQQWKVEFRAPYARKAIDQIRLSASTTMMDLLRLQTTTYEQDRQLDVLARVLAPYAEGISDKGYWEQHYDDYWALGLYYKRTGRIDDGNSLMAQACRIIEADKKFRAICPQWEDIIAEIQDDIEA